MVYTGDLKSPAARHAGSSPAFRTIRRSYSGKYRGLLHPKQRFDSFTPGHINKHISERTSIALRA